MPAQVTKTSTKRRKLAHDGDEDTRAAVSSKKVQKAFFSNATSWNLEDDYESRRRKTKTKDKEKAAARLPTRSFDGQAAALAEEDEGNVSIESDTDWLDGKEEDVELEDERPKPAPKPTIPEAQQIREAQEELAKLAGAMNENPEEHVGAFKAMAEVAHSEVPTVKMLALLTQMAVYKDVIPGYRIRSVLDEAKGEQLSKEVRQLRQYERALMSGYQNYLKDLTRYARTNSQSLPGGQSLSSIAINCAATLLTSVPHFNFRTDLLKILVNKLSRRRVDAEHLKCQEALETLFRDDDEGRPTLEAVSQLTKMMKAREYQVDESVLNLFLSLRLLSEFSGKGSKDDVEQQEGMKPKRNKKEFRTKRERKAMKEQKSLDRDMSQADALVSHEERDRMQSETLKLVFAAYFRILKARVPHLMGAVLEGLAKYAHLINQDFFGDLLEALKDLIRHSNEDADIDFGTEEEADENAAALASRNFDREALLCTVTAFALLSGQDAHNSRTALHLDLSYFTAHLFKALLPLAVQADLERTDRVPSSSTTSKVNVQTTTVLLLRSLSGVLLPNYNLRSVPPLRLAAFTKQLMTMALQLPEKSCQGVLALLNDVTHTHGKKVASLWNTEERKGDGQYNALSDNAEGSNPYAATAWENELLRKHFSPKVREGVKMLEKSVSS